MNEQRIGCLLQGVAAANALLGCGLLAVGSVAREWTPVAMGGAMVALGLLLTLTLRGELQRLDEWERFSFADEVARRGERLLHEGRLEPSLYAGTEMALRYAVSNRALYLFHRSEVGSPGRRGLHRVALERVRAAGPVALGELRPLQRFERWDVWLELAERFAPHWAMGGVGRAARRPEDRAPRTLMRLALPPAEATALGEALRTAGVPLSATPDGLAPPLPEANPTLPQRPLTALEGGAALAMFVAFAALSLSAFFWTVPAQASLERLEGVVTEVGYRASTGRFSKSYLFFHLDNEPEPLRYYTGDWNFEGVRAAIQMGSHVEVGRYRDPGFIAQTTTQIWTLTVNGETVVSYEAMARATRINFIFLGAIGSCIFVPASLVLLAALWWDWRKRAKVPPSRATHIEPEG